MQSIARIRSLVTAVPPHVLTQAEIAERTRRMFGLRMPEFERISPVFETAGIETRHAVRPSVWYESPHDWSDRSAVYLEAATELFVEAAHKAMAEAGVAAADIDTVVTVSSTGVATPSIEARAFASLGLSQRVSRVPVFGLGCAGGVTGLSIAARLAVARPGSNVLLVAVELCTLAVRLDQLTKANVVALALFGDGAAAAIVRAAPASGLASVVDSGEHTWPDTLDIMGWSVDPTGFGVIFDRSIPPFAEAHLQAAVDGILSGQGQARCDIDRFICHPGGGKVIEAVECALALPAGRLDAERAVLARYGNMSAPTALFVLKSVLEGGLPNRALLMALGPGFTLSTVSLEAAAA
jgi:alkylresorcinol/alkylpyrone synthase